MLIIIAMKELSKPPHGSMEPVAIRLLQVIIT
jgi:hypothetical protein